VTFIEKRNVEQYCNGKDFCDDEIDKFQKIIKVVDDCTGIIALRIGDDPTKKLKGIGIDVFMTCEKIEIAVEKAAEAILKEENIEDILRI